MAVAKMLKLQLLSHNSNRQQLLSRLQQGGMVSIAQIEEAQLDEFTEVALQEETGKLHSLLSRINFCLDLLNRFEQKKKGIIASLIPEKLVIGRKTYESIVDKLPFDDLYEKCEKLEVAIRKNESSVTDLNKGLKELEPWSELKLPLNIKETKNTIVKIGEIHNSVIDDFYSEIKKESALIHTDFVKSVGVIRYITVYIHKDSIDNANEILSKYGFKETDLNHNDGTAREEIKEIKKQLVRIEKEKGNLTQQCLDLLIHKPELTIAHDYVSNQLEKAEVQESFQKTTNCFLLHGWVAEVDKEKLTTLLKKYDTVETKFTKPGVNDNPPVKLINKKFIKPFEAITTMYGYPKYNELDPTPFLAPFFLVFFGLALGDVGYGTILILISLYIKKKLNLSENGNNFLNLFIIGGYSSIVAGVITGSYFAVQTEIINKYFPTILQKLIIFKPLEDPIPLLVFALMLGIIQIIFGILIEAYDNIRNKHLLDGILDSFPTIFMIIGSTLLISWLFKWANNMAAPWWSTYATWLTIIGAAGVVLLSNRKSKSIAGKIGGGLYNLYGMTSYLGDIISYARLMALGIATFLVGWSFNTMAALVFNSSIVAGIIFFFVLIVLHLVNLAINLIGAFVHPARLQFVEFFSKFFDGGGSQFEPFSIKTKKLYLK